MSDIYSNVYRPDTKQTRVVKRTVPTESFFNFFNPPKPVNSDDEENEEDDELEERLELDYHLGEDIKEKLIPRAVDWYTGEALQFEELDDEVEGEDFGDDDDDDLSDDRDEDDDDESEDEVIHSHILGGYAYLFEQDDGTKPKQEAAECKQS